MDLTKKAVHYTQEGKIRFFDRVFNLDEELQCARAERSCSKNRVQQCQA